MYACFYWELKLHKESYYNFKALLDFIYYVKNMFFKLLADYILWISYTEIKFGLQNLSHTVPEF